MNELKLKQCIVCGAPFFDTPLLICPEMPASAQDIPDAEHVSHDKGITLDLCQCSGCGLVQFDCTPVAYYRDTIRAGGFSTTMVELRRTQYAHFIEQCHLQGKKIVEVGCGRGEFLKVLTEFPVQAFGIEHKNDLVKIAQESGLHVTQGFAETAETPIDGAPFDAFLSFNFLEHQADPNAMLRCIYNNLATEAYGLITVPSFQYILENDGFYELLRDHIANYTEQTFRFVLEKNGFSVLECTTVNRDTLSAIVQKKKRVDTTNLYDNFSALSAQLQAFLSQRKEQGKKVAVWGASHQGFTLLSTTGVGADIVYIIDSAPFKQGRYAPASHVKIVSPDYFFAHPADTVLIVAPGYTDEIAGIIRNKLENTVEIAVLKSRAIKLLE